MIDIHLPEMIHAALLSEHKGNSNKQNKHMFEELKRNIREQGFDESLIVRPSEDGLTYEVVAGNHRFRAGLAEGMEEFPCVIRKDWDDVEAEIQSVRRNYVRGRIDKKAFTSQVDKLSDEAGLLMGDIMDRMGFADEETFAHLYEEEKEREEQIAAATMTAPAVKMIDDLGYVISAIMEKYGDTVPNSFIIFPTGGKNHLFIASNPALKKCFEAVAEYCVENNLDINIALTGLLQVGITTTNFKELKLPEEGETGDIEPIGV